MINEIKHGKRKSYKIKRKQGCPVGQPCFLFITLDAVVTSKQ